VSDSWDEWRRDVFGDPYLVWHEGPDFARLLRLVRREPAEVRRMLAVGLDTADPLAAQSLAALADAGSAPADAEALLRAAVPGATDAFLVRVAQALHVVTGDGSWAGPIAAVLASRAFWGVRIDAAMALAGFAPTVELIGTLGDGVADEEYLVRCHCANTLLRYAGRTRRVDAIPTLFAKIKDVGPGTALAVEELTAAALRGLTAG
jgi:hypothetical protein